MRGIFFAVLGVVVLGCSGGEAPEGLSRRLSDAECDHILEIETNQVRQEELVTPSEAEVAVDALDPDSADPAEYGVVVAVEQTFVNQLDRTVVIDEAGAELTPDGANQYQADYQLSEPIELGPHESATVEFFVTITADEASPGYLVGFVEMAALGMRVAPYVHITIPGSDNCGYPEGIVVRGAEGDVEVNRPVHCGLFCDVLGALFKGMAHG